MTTKIFFFLYYDDNILHWEIGENHFGYFMVVHVMQSPKTIQDIVLLNKGEEARYYEDT